jgi:hypothetical protein
MELLIMKFSPFPVTSSLLGPKILLNMLFSNTLSLRSSLNVSDQVTHPYKTTDKIVALYILIFKFAEEIGTQKILHRMIATHSLQTDLTAAKTKMSETPK